MMRAARAASECCCSAWTAHSLNLGEVPRELIEGAPRDSHVASLAAG